MSSHQLRLPTGPDYEAEARCCVCGSNITDGDGIQPVMGEARLNSTHLSPRCTSRYVGPRGQSSAVICATTLHAMDRTPKPSNPDAS